MQLLKFKQHLDDNPALMHSSKNVYYKAIKELVNDIGEAPTIEQFNHFIAVKCNKRQPHVKYAVKEYLKFLGRLELRPDYRDTSKPTVLLSKKVAQEYRRITEAVKSALEAVAAETS